MALFKQNVEAQQTLERESTFIGKEAINPSEARLIRYLRSTKKFADKGEN